MGQADHLGSTTTMLNAAGQIVNGPQQYLPYGQISQCCADTDKSFTGHQKEDSLYFMKARFVRLRSGQAFDPAAGRFL
jgi:hypothetical protein